MEDHGETDNDPAVVSGHGRRKDALTTDSKHVRGVLNKLQGSWLPLRKALSTQARTSNVEPITDYSIGFDDFAAAVEMAGISVTRMQLDAVFNLIDADKVCLYYYVF